MSEFSQTPVALARPAWIRARCGVSTDIDNTREILRRHALHTVCESAQCPNLGACWAQRHATVMILGDECTRGCRFCGVTACKPRPPDPDEPRRVAAAVAESGLRHIVLTSVTRDDLPDGGSAHWAATLRAVRAACPEASIEALIPDFAGDAAALRAVFEARPDILGHNLETVPRLYPLVRSGADYGRSLDVLRAANAFGLVAKTSLMLGLGETDAEVLATLGDARSVGVRIVFLGQYLQPSPRHAPVLRYVSPADFAALREQAQALGFETVRAAPLLRSSTPPGVADA